MTQKEQLATALNRVAELEAEAVTRTEASEKIQSENVSLHDLVKAQEASNAELTQKLETAHATIFKLEGEKATLGADKAKVDAENEKLSTEARSADTRAREIAARNGTLLPAKDLTKLGEDLGGSKVMTRADFDTLSAKAKMAFCRAGGRLTD